jgi:hypothetical protein
MSTEGMSADHVVQFDLIVLPSQGCLTKYIGKVCVKLNLVSFAGMMHRCWHANFSNYPGAQCSSHQILGSQSSETLRRGRSRGDVTPGAPAWPTKLLFLRCPSSSAVRNQFESEEAAAA